MSRSRNRLLRPCLVLAGLLTCLVFASPALAADGAHWSPKLAYVLTTGEVRAALTAKLHLTKEQDRQLRAIGFDLESAQRDVQRRSDLIVMDDGRTLEQKREAIARLGYNGSLQSAEDSAALRLSRIVGMPTDQLSAAVGEVWQTDAATHNLETELTAMGLTPQAVVGSFKVYASRFTDEYGNQFGVAMPDKYVKFASNDTQYAPGYPDGTYAVSLYWDGIHHGRDNNQNTAVTTPHSVASARVLDVGPWNTDDNWWNSYTDPVRPRRINNAGISGNGGLVGKAHLAIGLPESQAAYFSYYGRPPWSDNDHDGVMDAGEITYTLWGDRARGYNGQWSGADQFGRQVTQPAGIDLTPSVCRAIAMTRDRNGDGIVDDDTEFDNEWIEVVPLWEARLEVVGGIQVTPGPYLTGQRVSFTYTVQNLGSLPGTWQTFTFRTWQGSKYIYSPGVGPVTLAPGQSRTFSFSQILETTGNIQGWARTTRGGENSDLGSSVTLANVGARTVDRIGGGDRYATAVKMSQAAYPGTAKAVVIATGLNFPDALAGAALAHAEDGPMLLVGQTLPASVEAEVKRLQPTKIIILGSSKVVSSAIASQLAAAVPAAAVSRLGGWNRYATARLIAAQVVAKTGGVAPNGTAIIATGRNFPDALSASVLSADKYWPILLTEPGFVPTDTAAALSGIGATRTYVIGGTSVISDAAAAALPAPTRIAGGDRYATSALVADLGEANGLNYAYVGITVGTNYPDALAGGVLAAKSWGTLLLTSPAAVPTSVKNRLQSHRTVTTHLQAYGSAAALPDATFRQAEDAIR